jgi:predicted KAP-like P-loop ATPase
MPAEIQEVFRTVKAVADFPNMTYLLAFDRRLVTDALGSLKPGSGDEYLEKIVQLPFDLPPPDRQSLWTFFSERLDSILSQAKTTPFDRTYWGNVFLDGISKFLETPRDVIRLTNALSLTFRAVADEVNPVDFVAIETFRVFLPEVYDIVRRNKEMFAGSSPNGSPRPRRDDLKKFHDEWLNGPAISDRRYTNPVQTMLKRLFPRFNSVWENIQYGPEWEPQWRLQRRVCSEDIFPVYFSFTVPTGELSNLEMQSILGEAADRARFSETLRRLANKPRPDGTSYLTSLLDRLQDYTQSVIPTENIEPIVLVLFDIGDELVIPGQMGLVGSARIGNDILMSQITWQLLRRVDRDGRFRILEQAFRGGRAIYMMQQAVVVLGQQQGKYGERTEPEEEWFVTSEQLASLEALLIERIKVAAEDGVLLGCPGLPWVLNFWRAMGNEAEVKKWAMETTKEDSNLALFLEKFMQVTAIFTFGGVVPKKHDRLDPEWVRPYLDPDGMLERVRTLTKLDSLTERQRRAARQFLKEYQFRESGGNPDNPLELANLTSDEAGSD